MTDSMTLYTNPMEVLEKLGLPAPHMLAMAQLLDALVYPLAPDDTVVDMSFTRAVAAYHLARLGFGLVNEPVIKKQEVSGPGIIEGACYWVPADQEAPPLVYKSPLDDLENMTINEINALPTPMKRLAYEKLGLPFEEPGWQRKPILNIDDAPDTDDGPDWTGR